MTVPSPPQPPAPPPVPPDPSLPPSPPSATPLWRRVARGLWLLLVSVLLGLALADRWEEVSETVVALTVPGVVLAGLAVIAGIGLSWVMWRTFLAGLGVTLPARHGARVFFVGQLSKYVPGTVWSLLALMEYGRDHRIQPRTSAASLALFMGTHLTTGATVAAATVPATGTVPAWWALAAVPAALAGLLPQIQGWILTVGLRLLRRQPLAALPDWTTVLRANAWALGMWVAWGAHLWVLARAAGSDLGIVAATGVFAAAWVAGFLVLPVPAGAGVREFVFVFLLVPAGATSQGAALALAVLSRLLFTITDMFWGAVGLVWGRRGTVRATVAEIRSTPAHPHGDPNADT